MCCGQLRLISNRMQRHHLPIPGAGESHEAEVKQASAVADRMRIQTSRHVESLWHQCVQQPVELCEQEPEDEVYSIFLQ